MKDKEEEKKFNCDRCGNIEKMKDLIPIAGNYYLCDSCYRKKSFDVSVPYVN